MRNQKGQVLVETAIILPLLLLLLFAVFDYARAMYTKNTLNNAARAGARAAAVTPGLTATAGVAESGPLSSASTPTAAVLQKNMFNQIAVEEVTYELKVLEVTIDPLTNAVTTSGVNGPAKGGHLVQVNVTWPSFKMVTPIYTLLAWMTDSPENESTRVLTGEASMRYE